MEWPKRGVYFFFEDGEDRSNIGNGPRIVRVGTHAVRTGSTTKLWTRLYQHKGQPDTGGGNHRGSIFRLLVGDALTGRDQLHSPTWGKQKTAGHDVKIGELELERHVSKVIGSMPFVWLDVADEARPESLRGYVERNAIALLSNYNKPPHDPPSKKWLGNYSTRERVRKSGLWNQIHVGEGYESGFLDVLERLISEMRLKS